MAANRTPLVTTQSKAMKVTLVLDHEPFRRVVVPNGEARSKIEVAVGGRQYLSEVNAKSLRRCIAAIVAAEPGTFVVTLIGRLEGNIIMEAGIACQLKTPKPHKSDTESAVATALAEIL